MATVEVVAVTPSAVEVVEVASSNTIVQLVTEPVVVAVSNDRGPQGPQGNDGPPGVVPVFSVVGVAYVRSGTHRFYVERSATLTKVRASLGSPASGSPVIVTVNVNGVLAGTVTVAAGDYTATTTLSHALAPGDYLTVDITSVGSTSPGTDLTVSATIE